MFFRLMQCITVWCVCVYYVFITCVCVCCTVTAWTCLVWSTSSTWKLTKTSMVSSAGQSWTAFTPALTATVGGVSCIMGNQGLAYRLVYLYLFSSFQTPFALCYYNNNNNNNTQTGTYLLTDSLYRVCLLPQGTKWSRRQSLPPSGQQ